MGPDIGLVLGAFGIKGELRILSLNEEPERFRELKEIVMVDSDGSEKVMKIDKVRIHKKHALVKLIGVNDRTEAERYKGVYVRLASGDLTAAEETRIERQNLVGFEVLTKSGERLGVIEEVIQTGANDVYEVNNGKDSYLIPAIKSVVVEVDFEACRMVVDPLPGLL